jgi:hypothetical protein
LIFQSGSAIRSPEDFANHIVPSLGVGSLMMVVAFLGIALFVKNKAPKGNSQSLQPAQNADSMI